MLIYTLFYYDRPFLEAWLNHYCHIPCIEEILIQNQNWDPEDTEYLLDTVARYIDDYGVKIAVLPSRFKRYDAVTTKRAQFHAYGQPTIRNRVAQFLVGKTFITGAPDSAVYGQSYADTNRKLVEFEEYALERARAGENTCGYMKLYSVTKRKFHMGGDPSVVSVHWKNRVNHFAVPFRYTGAPVHDMQIAVFRDGRWHDCTPKSGHYLRSDFHEGEVKLDLRILHYHPLFRPSANSTQFIPCSKREVENLEEHPRHYVDKLLG